MIKFTVDYRTTQYGDGGLIPAGTVTSVFTKEQEDLIIEQDKAFRTTGKDAVPDLDMPALHAEDDAGRRRQAKTKQTAKKAVKAALGAIQTTEDAAKDAAEAKRKPRRGQKKEE